MKLETIYRYIQDQANPQEIEEVESWINKSEDNQDQFNRIKQSLQIAATWTPKSNTGLGWSKVSDRIGTIKPKLSWIRPLIAAAAVILILGGIFLLRDINKGENYFTQVGQQETVLLADRSTVHLNAGSKLKFQNRKSSRTAHLNGEALFEISYDPVKPFSVIVNDVEILVTGTVFSVEAYPASNNVKVRVLEGNITCKLTGQEDQSLKAGEMIHFDKIVKQMTKSEINNEGLTGTWQSGLLAFDNEFFEDNVNHFIVGRRHQCFFAECEKQKCQI